MESLESLEILWENTPSVFFGKAFSAARFDGFAKRACAVGGWLGEGEGMTRANEGINHGFVF